MSRASGTNSIVGRAATYMTFMLAYVVPRYLAHWQPNAAYLCIGASLDETLTRWLTAMAGA